MPCARAICSFVPVARIAEPVSVPKNQYKSAISVAEKTAPVISELRFFPAPVTSESRFISVATPKSGMFALPITLIFIEYKAIIVKMPAKMPGIFSFVCKRAVAAPARQPEAKAAKTAKKGSTRALISTAPTAPPRAKLPSTVRSGKSSTLKVIKTPKAIMPHRIPCEAAPCTASKNPIP